MNNIEFSQTVWKHLQQVKNTSKKSEKEAIIKKLMLLLSNNNKLNLFIDICKHVFDYQLVFFMKKLPEINHDKLNSIFSIEYHINNGIVKSLLSRNVTGNKAKDELDNAFKHSDCIETAYILKCILDKTFDVGADHTTFSKAYGGNIVDEHKVSLCTPGTQELIDNFKYPALGQLKYDAMRIEIDITNERVNYVTRPGKTILSNNPQLDNIISSYVLTNIKQTYAEYGYNIEGSRVHIDGEMIFRDAKGNFLPRQASNGIANKVAKGGKEMICTDEIAFCVWDIITPEEKQEKIEIPYNIRFEILKKTVYGIRIFNIAETVLLSSPKEAIQLAITYIKSGQEGCIVKELNQPWTPKRVKSQIKLKAARECEMRITGVNISDDTKYNGLVGSLITTSEDGKVIANISGMSDDDRKEYLNTKYIGRIITVRYNELTTNKDDANRFSLFLPRIVELREDKFSADTYESIRDADFIVVA